MEEFINFILTVILVLLLLSPILYFIYKKDKEYRSMPARESKPDKNSIAIYHEDGHHLGYIPADYTDDIRYIFKSFPVPIWGEIEKDYDFDGCRSYFRGIIYTENPKVSP